jgi:hypothetical protein
MAPASSGRRRLVFDRLVANKRMQSVYGVFLQLDRQTGNYRYAARKRKNGQSAQDAQVAGVREILQLSVCTASDCMSVSTEQQLEGARQRWRDDSSRIRVLASDVELAADLGMLGFDDPASKALALQDCVSLRRIAGWLEILTSGIRTSGDPLVVKRHRGDPIVRGVQILISGQIDEHFGERLDGTAATLTSVALAVDTTPRTSRSALTRRKPQKKRSPR